MVQVKTELFSEELTDMSHLFKALAHPARVQILQFLARQDSCITGDISDEIPLGRTTVNQHIKELKQAGLIQGEICGVKTKYCLNPQAIAKLKSLMTNFIDELEGSVCSSSC